MPRALKKVIPSNEELLAQTCQACPYLEKKCPDPPESEADILVISDPMINRLDNSFSVPALHLWAVECLDLNLDENVKQKVDPIAETCCWGRKITAIERIKPKLIIAIGFKVFKRLEELCGYKVTTKNEYGLILPSSYKGHNFWLLCLRSEGAVQAAIMDHGDLIQEALQAPPAIKEGNLDGIEFVTETEEIGPAFDWLMVQDILAFDIETVGFKPYANTAKLLSISIGTKEKVYAFPLEHPQTPSKLDVALIFQKLAELFKKVPMIAHNLIFELEWIGFALGNEVLFPPAPGKFHDTMAQSYLTTKASNSLDACIRRFFGFSLKAISDLDVGNLVNLPLEQVLNYNALDVKYTHALYEVQKQIIEEKELEQAYEMHIERIPALAAMQIKGLVPDLDFIAEQSKLLQIRIKKAEKDFNNLAEVKAMVEKYGSCNPASNPDLKKLFYEYCGVNVNVNSFDAEFLKTFKHPVASIILELREASKLYSTYIYPYDSEVGRVEKGDILLIHDDGLIHTSFFSMYTATGRLSSRNPNVQNEPSRGGKKYLRNKVKAPLGKVFVAIDYAQIEFRIAIAFMKDPILLKMIWDDYDVHMQWAKEIVQYVPDFFVKDPEDKAAMEIFRSLVKNQFVFPLMYGASQTNILGYLGIAGTKFEKNLRPIFAEFHKKHQAIKPWHRKLQNEYLKFGYLTTPLGRKFFAPLRYTDIINYTVQGTASDIVIKAMSRLARMSVELNEPDLCPVLNIHDDLSFCIDEDKLEELLEIIIKVMLDVKPYPWLGLPLEIEVSTGPSWGSLTKLGKFKSSELDSDA